MIHFQAKTEGATLRGSDLKPRLDKFIIRKLLKSDSKTAEERLTKLKASEYQHWLYQGNGAQHPSLDYTVKIFSLENSDDKEINITNRDKMIPYFGNRAFLAIEKDLVCLEIQSRNKGLFEFILDNTYEFFFWNNFGTRNTKGFGSYFPVDQPKNFDLIRPKYWFDIETNNTKRLFEIISKFYSTLRSGINVNGFYFKSLLWKYLRDNDHQWDKRSIKEKFLARAIEDETTDHEDEINGDFDDFPLTYESREDKKDLKLWRDVLGLSTDQSWYYYKATVKKEHVYSTKETKIDRFPSPLFFKPLRLSAKTYRVYFDVPLHIKEAFMAPLNYSNAESEILGEKFKIKFNNAQPLELAYPNSFDFDDFFKSAFATNLESYVQNRGNQRDFKELKKIYSTLKTQVQ